MILTKLIPTRSLQVISSMVISLYSSLILARILQVESSFLEVGGGIARFEKRAGWGRFLR